MVNVRQLVVQVVISTMALGGVFCWCPAAAETPATFETADAHHHHGSESANEAADQADCGHEDCEAGCERGSVAASKASGKAGGMPAFQLDHVSSLPSDIAVVVPVIGADISFESSRFRIPLRQETPVQRFDRLLD